jgi:hypothetical protein
VAKVGRPSNARRFVPVMIATLSLRRSSSSRRAHCDRARLEAQDGPKRVLENL